MLDLQVPPYGQTTLADLVPSLMSALGAPGFTDTLQLAPLAGVCLLVVDGLGWELLRAHPQDAPFLNRHAATARPLAAGFPSTTAASLASVGTGLPPGEHGLVGYAIALLGEERAMNLITWRAYGPGPSIDLRDTVVPERFQPRPTALERAAAEGVAVSLVGPAVIADSGLTRAVLRGGEYRPAVGPDDLVAQAVSALGKVPRSFVYAYHSDLDATGHVRGVQSEAWRLQLARVDRLAEALADRLPPDRGLMVTADHGMVDLPGAGRIDLGDEPELAAGVRLLAGEARARHVYTKPGAAPDVLAAWRAVLGDRMVVVARDEAVAAGWFGPTVRDEVLARIGDVVALACAPVGVFQRSVDAVQARFVGHHGSATRAEQLVPGILIRR